MLRSDGTWFEACWYVNFVLSCDARRASKSAVFAQVAFALIADATVALPELPRPRTA